MTAMVTVNTGIVITPELWGCNVMPEGILERWLVAEGSTVHRGDAVATIRIEDCLHKWLRRLRVGFRGSFPSTAWSSRAR